MHQYLIDQLKHGQVGDMFNGRYHDHVSLYLPLIWVSGGRRVLFLGVYLLGPETNSTASIILWTCP